MYNISDELRVAMQSEAIITTARITVLDDNTVIDGNNLCTVKITDKCYQDGVIIGTAMCKELEIELINDNFDLADKEFSLEVGVKLSSGEYKYIPYGNYIVKEYTDTKSSNKYTIIAYDYMDKLNTEFTDDYDYTEPITLQKFYENFAKFYDIEIVEQTLPNQDFLIGNKPYFDGMTGREVAARIAEMFGSFAKFNRENKLQMYLQTPTNEKISRNEMNSSLTINNKFGPINTVVLRLSNIEGENVTLKDEESIKTNGEVTLQIQDNPFIYTEDLRKKAIQAIFDRVKGFEYYPTSFNSKLIYFDCGDIVEVQNMNSDEYYPTMILDQTLQIPNTIKSAFANEALTSTAVKNQYTSAQTVKNRRTEYLIDKQNQKITETIAKTTEIEEKSIYSVQVLYALSSSETEAPTEGWSTTAPTWENGKYMWQKTVTIYGDGSAKESSPTNISGAKGENGADGKDGANGKNGTNGKDGKKGDTGIGVSLLETEYYLSTSDEEQAGGEWLTTEPKYETGKHYWTRTKITWTDGNITYTDPILAEGINNANQSVDNITNTEGTASGKNIHIEDSSEEPLADIVVKGETKQEGEPSPDTPVEIENVEGKNILNYKLVTNASSNDTVSLIENGFNVKGLYAGKVVVNNLQKNTDYYLQYLTENITGTQKNVSVFAGTSQTTRIKAFTNGIGGTFNTGENTEINIWFYGSMGDGEGKVNFTNIQLEEGSVATEYVPYNSLEFKVMGKNLVNPNNVAKGFVDDNTGLVLGISGQNKNTGYIEIIGGEKYFILSNKTSGNWGAWYDKDKKYISGIIYAKASNYNIGEIFTAPNEACFMAFTVSYNNNNPDYANNVMIARTDELVDYEPYKSQTETFPLAEGQKLYESSYLADDGIHHTRKQYVITGEENWALGTQYTPEYGTRFDCNITTYPKAGRTNAVVCSHYKYKGACWVNYEGGGNYLQLRIQDNFETVDELKTYLQEQYTNGTPVIVEYELAEEEIIPYTEEQQEAWNKIKELHTYKNITNITSTADLDIVYVRDNGLSDMYETKQNANKNYTTYKNQIVQVEKSLSGISNKVTEVGTSLNNDYYTKDDVDTSLETLMNDADVKYASQTEFKQTKDSFQLDIHTIQTEGVTKVKTTTGYTFDNEGFKLNRDGAETGTIIDEAAIRVIDKTSSTSQDLLYAGYIKEGNTDYSEYIGQTIVAAANIIVKNFLVVPNSRFETYENLTLGGTGTGVFGV